MQTNYAEACNHSLLKKNSSPTECIVSCSSMSFFQNKTIRTTYFRILSKQPKRTESATVSLPRIRTQNICFILFSVSFNIREFRI